jgi:GT2 family glycosyltransferase
VESCHRCACAEHDVFCYSVTGALMESVSVIIPTYNRGHFLLHAVRSVLAQTRVPDEVLIIDDGSTDDTERLCADLPAPVRYLRVENGGVGRARNIGLQQARGDWIAFLDSDDSWEPNKMEVQLDVLAANPQAHWAISDFRLMRPDGAPVDAPGFESCFGLFRELNRTPASVFAGALERRRHVAGGTDHLVFTGDAFDLFFLGNFGLPSTALLRRTLIERAGPFDPSFRVAGDNEFFHRVSAHGEVAIIMSALAVWRVGHGDKLSGASNTPELIAGSQRSMSLASKIRPLSLHARRNYDVSRRLLSRRLAYEWLSQYRPSDARSTIWRSIVDHRDRSAKAFALLGMSLLPRTFLRWLHVGKQALTARRQR